MKACFIASHSQKKDLGNYYKRIVNVLQRHDCTVFTGSLFEEEVDFTTDQKSRKKWYKNEVNHIKNADVVVVEISYPSTANVGHELTYALDLGIPVVALYKSDRDPLFLRGREDDKLTILSYEDDNLEDMVMDGLDIASDQQDTRFNFFISPKHQAYLDWVAKEQKVPRAVFLRRLINEDLEKNMEFQD